MKADILVVDDGYRPTTEEAAKLRPDLILIDMQMPQMSGIDAARAFKADPTLEHVPRIAMSPSDDFEPLFVSFLHKPTSSAKLFAAIWRALRR